MSLLLVNRRVGTEHRSVSKFLVISLDIAFKEKRAFINQCVLLAPRTVHLVGRCSFYILYWVFIREVKGGRAVHQIREDMKRHRRKRRRGRVQVWQRRLWDVARGRDDVLRGVIVGLESGERSKVQIWTSSSCRCHVGETFLDSKSSFSLSPQPPPLLTPFPSFLHYILRSTYHLYLFYLSGCFYMSPRHPHGDLNSIRAGRSLVFAWNSTCLGQCLVPRCSKGICWMNKWRARRGRSLMAMINDGEGSIGGRKRGDPERNWGRRRIN